jgi:hypothetical protein
MNKALYDETDAVLKAVDQNWQSNITTIGSAKQPPLTKFDAYVFSSYTLARAANQLKDKALLETSKNIFQKADDIYYPTYVASLNPFAEDDRHSDIRDIIRAYRQILMAHPRAQEVEPYLRRMWEQSDPDAMNEQLVFQAKTEEGTHKADAILETIKDAGKPLSLAGGLIAGKIPTGMDPNTFRLIQVGVYGGLVAGVLGFTYLYIRPFLPKRD